MLKTFATICIIGMFTSSCTSKKASRTEGSHEAEQELNDCRYLHFGRQ